MKDFIENQYGRAVREASPYERFAVSTVGAAISRPPMTKLPPFGRLIAAPTDAEVFARHARVGVPYGCFPEVRFYFFNRLRSRHLSHSPLVLSP